MQWKAVAVATFFFIVLTPDKLSARIYDQADKEPPAAHDSGSKCNQRVYNVIREHAVQEGAMKTKKAQDIFLMTKAESETHLAKATRAEIKRHHAAGRATAHGDEKGVYKLYPNGRKEYVKLYEKEPDTKKVLMAAGCER